MAADCLNVPFLINVCLAYFMTHLRLIRGVTLCGVAFLFSACEKPAEDTTAVETPVVEAPAVEILAVETPAIPVVAETVADELVFDNASKQASYGVGYNIGTSIVASSAGQMDLESLVAGIRDSSLGIDPRVDQATIQAAFAELEAKMIAADEAVGNANLSVANEWLAENAKREGVIVTESGLQYEVITSGDGPTPGPDNSVEVHYHGTLIDGTVFDSSVERGQTVNFPVAGVIPGWVEALQLMKVGDKWRLFIPPNLAYGARAQGRIPSNSALIFEVELISIE